MLYKIDHGLQWLSGALCRMGDWLGDYCHTNLRSLFGWEKELLLG
jgi:hypothetical protein